MTDRAAAIKGAEEALRNVESERLVGHIREAAKFATRADRMVFLHDYEAKALLVATYALRALLSAAREAEAALAERTAVCEESNAVCLCGCPDAEHEADECGESCWHDDHECIRVAKAVLAYVERLRSTPPPPSDAVREAAEAVSQTYYEIAAEAIGEDKVKAEFSSRFEERLAKRRDAARGGE